MKLGCIDYLNCYPFYYHMLEIEPIPGVQIFRGYPSDLNRMMTKGELHMSPISAAAYADLEGDVILLPDFCLSSIGYVHSVILISKVPLEDLNQKRVGLSSASQTSVVLLKMLLSHFYHVEPVYLPTDPKPSLNGTGLDAALVIGNEALAQSTEPVPYTYDLGDLWLRKTGNPVVFAVFAVQTSIVNKFADEIESIVRSYHRSIGCLKEKRAQLLIKAKERYPKIQYNMDAYFNTLQYSFTSEMKKALTFYLSLAGELDLIKKVETVQFLDGSIRQTERAL